MDRHNVSSMAGVFGGKNSKDTDSPDLMGVNCVSLFDEFVIALGHIQLIVGGRIGPLNAGPQ
jgi:hypothetical protein